MAGYDEKLAVCKDRGANVCTNYKMENFVKMVKEEFGEKGIFSNIKTSLFFNNRLVKQKNMIIILLSGHFHREVFVIVVIVKEVNKLFLFSRHISYTIGSI